MTNKRQTIVVAGALGALAAAFAIKKLLEDPKIRRRLGLDRENYSELEARIDAALEDSFPASDPPSFSPIKAGGGSY